MSSTITYGNIKLVSPFEILHLSQLRIEKENNEHARIFLTGVIPEEKKFSYVDSVSSKDILEVSQISDDSGTTVLFKGTITNIEIKAVRGIFYIIAEGVSCTYELDIKLKSRSFQDKDMLYTAMLKEIIKDHSGADFIDTTAKSKKLEKVVIQYDETDWEFLKRMASHFNAGLVPDATSDKPKFWFGIPDRSSSEKLEEFNFSVRKKIGDYRYLSENYMDGIDEKDFIYYEIETDKFLGIGDKVQYNNLNLIVCKATYYFEDSVLSHLYHITTEKGLSQKLKLNEKLFGAAIEGKVIDIKEDNVRVHLDIDEVQNKEKSFWFSYATFYTSEGSTGWYCMPETDDRVKLYFPTNKEEEGVVINSIRRKTNGGDKIQNPDEKYFRTKYGKEEMFREKELVLSAKDNGVLIRLNEESGIEIYSDNTIKLKDDNDLDMEADNIEIKAADEINIECNDSRINMNGTTHIRGSLVKVRC
ncbi:MAG: hypothetical protein BWY74_02444 [Firmicutes bacterium ADurb.Bin419]|nr:MAG: hypothetical protein BWY74_02444 [Firmicutes bacterium ADurb.Bin419]